MHEAGRPPVTHHGHERAQGNGLRAFNTDDVRHIDRPLPEAVSSTGGRGGRTWLDFIASSQYCNGRARRPAPQTADYRTTLRRNRLLNAPGRLPGTRRSARTRAKSGNRSCGLIVVSVEEALWQDAV